eukprot:Colp12_sorted_trinity150504_noHs@35436
MTMYAESLAEQNTELAEDNKILRESLDEAEFALEQEKRDRQKLQADFEMYLQEERDKVYELERNLRQVTETSQAPALQSEMEQLARRVSLAEHRAQDASRQREEMHQELLRYKKFQIRCKELETEVEQLRARSERCAQLEEVVKHLEVELQEVVQGENRKLQSYEEDIQELADLNSELEAQVTSLKNHTTFLEKALEEKTRTVETLQERLHATKVTKTGKGDDPVYDDVYNESASSEPTGDYEPIYSRTYGSVSAGSNARPSSGSTPASGPKPGTMTRVVKNPSGSGPGSGAGKDPGYDEQGEQAAHPPDSPHLYETPQAAAPVQQEVAQAPPPAPKALSHIELKERMEMCVDELAHGVKQLFLVGKADNPSLYMPACDNIEAAVNRLQALFHPDTEGEMIRVCLSVVDMNLSKLKSAANRAVADRQYVQEMMLNAYDLCECVKQLVILKG